MTDDLPTRQDCVLYARAIRNRWAIPDDVYQSLPQKMLDILDSGTPREQVAAANVLLAMNKANQAAEKDERKRGGNGRKNTARQKLIDRLAVAIANRLDGGTAGTGADAAGVVAGDSAAE